MSMSERTYRLALQVYQALSRPLRLKWEIGWGKGRKEASFAVFDQFRNYGWQNLRYVRSTVRFRTAFTRKNYGYLRYGGGWTYGPYRNRTVDRTYLSAKLRPETYGKCFGSVASLCFLFLLATQVQSRLIAVVLGSSARRLRPFHLWLHALW